MTTLTQQELQTLQQMRDDAMPGGYWQIYTWLADTLETKGVASDDSAVLWLRGATEANAGRGAMFALIRAYTETQYQLRYGSEIPAGKMQEASDAVAQNLLRDVLGENEEVDGWPRGLVPDISRIAEGDAMAVGRVLFGPDLGHDESDAAFLHNSAWSGALLFTLLRSDQAWRLINGGNGAAMDTVSDLRDVLFAYQAYAKGLQAAWFAYWAGDEYQKDRDINILDSTITGYLLSPGGAASVATAILAGTINSIVAPLFERIVKVGLNNSLDMVSGAHSGKVLLGTTTDANFEGRANDFFGDLSLDDLLAAAQVLPTDAGGLASAARTDVNARAALAGLSVFKVQVEPEVADRLAMVDWSAGTGDISANWITDRAAFTAYHYKKLQGLGGIVNGSDNLRFFDAASNTEVLVGAGSAQRKQFIFGGDSDDQATGQGFEDHLYGGAGNDTLSGLGGNDWLDGGDGDDTLEGGAGTDVLYGGRGNDRYNFTSGEMVGDIVRDLDGQGTLWVDGVQLTGGKKQAGNVWLSDDKQWTYLLTATGDLIISKADSNDRLIVRGWQGKDAKLGIDLESVAAPAPAPAPAPGNVIAGTANADAITGTTADELIQGLGGDDLIDARAGGNNLIEAGAGIDVVMGGAGQDTVLGGAGRDVLFAHGGDDEIWGADKTDFGTINGQSEAAPEDEADFIAAGAGADHIYGGAAADALFGGGGGDFIVAGAGDDNILADYYAGTTFTTWQLTRTLTPQPDGSIRQRLNFTDTGYALPDDPGNDIIFAGAGADWVMAGAGDDFVDAGTGNDLVYGMAGADVIDGRDGDDDLYGDGTYSDSDSLDMTLLELHRAKCFSTQASASH